MAWNLILGAVMPLLDKILPDAAQKADAKIRLLELAQAGDLAALNADMQLALGQMEINKAEATTDMFRGGWRPAVGWICVLGLGYQFLLQPLLPWVVAVAGLSVIPLPDIAISDLLVLLGGMLGLGGFRTFEKVKGIG